MRTIQINAGTVDVRHDVTTNRYCLVFEAQDASLRLFRTMGGDEFNAFTEHVARVRDEHPMLKAGEG